MLFLLLSHGKDQRICVIELESGGILVNMKGAVFLVMGGLAPVHAPTLLVIGAVLGQDRALQEGEMTTLLPHHSEMGHVTDNLQDVNQKSMKKTGGDLILLLVEVAACVVLIIMLMERGHHQLTVTDHLRTRARGRRGNPLDHQWGRAQGPLMLLLSAATDRLVVGARHVAASPSASMSSSLASFAGPIKLV